jgi:hypothetical protein
MTRERQQQVVIAFVSAAMAGPILLPAFPGALVGCAALLGALCVFVRARTLSAWLVVAWVAVLFAAALVN